MFHLPFIKHIGMKNKQTHVQASKKILHFPLKQNPAYKLGVYFRDCHLS